MKRQKLTFRYRLILLFSFFLLLFSTDVGEIGSVQKKNALSRFHRTINFGDYNNTKYILLKFNI